jgi:hypothetical protein
LASAHTECPEASLNLSLLRTSATSANPSLVSPSPWQNTTRPDWIDSLRGEIVMVPSEFRRVVLVMMLLRADGDDDDGSDSA